MRYRNHRLLTTALAALSLCLVMLGCGKSRDLSMLEPDYVDPPWYDDYKADRRIAYDRYDDKVIQLEMQVTDLDDTAAGIEVTGITGFGNLYRASCKFSRDARESLKNVKEGSLITVKGLFSHMQELSNSYKIYLTNCVIV
jgi:hypothetical protein